MQSLSKLSVFRAVSRQTQKTRLGYGVALFLWSLVNIAVPYAQAQSTAEKLVAAKPFVSTVVKGMAVTTDRKGTPYAVTMQQGVNAPLSIVDLKSMRLVFNSEQRNDGRESAGVAYATLANRHVVIGTSTGLVYDIDPDKQAATDQTPTEKPKGMFVQAINDGQSTAYFLAREGQGGRVYRYTASTTAWRDLGTVPSADGGLAFISGKLYVGAGNALMQIQIQNGTQSTLAVPNLPADTNLRVSGASSGYVYLQSDGAKPMTLVYDLASRTVVDQQTAFGDVVEAMPPANTQTPVQTPTTAAPAPAASQTTTQPTPSTTPTATDTTPTTSTTTGQGNAQNANPKPSDKTNTTPTTPAVTTTTTQTAPTQEATPTVPVAATEPVKPVLPSVYFGGLSRYNPNTKSVEEIVRNTSLRLVTGSCWIDQTHCVVYDEKGRLGIVNTASRSLKQVSPSPIMGGYHTVDSLAMTGDDTMYASSTAPGTAVFQSDRDKALLSRMIAPVGSATTSMLAKGNVVFAGSSTGTLARYQKTDTADSLSFSQVTTVGTGAVTAMTQAGGGQLAFGLSSTSGAQAGSVGVYDVVKGSMVLAPQVVAPGQGVSSLVTAHPTLYIGTTTNDTNTAGVQVLAYNLSTRTVVAKSVPVPGAKSVTSLVIGENGHVYGTAGSTVFELNPQSLATVHTQSFYAMDVPANIVSWHQHLYASVGGKVYQIRESDLGGTVIANGTHVAVNSLGDVYYARDGGVYKLLAERQAAPAVTAAHATSGLSISPVSLRLGMTTLALIVLTVVIPIVRLHFHRPTYRIRR